MLKFVIMIDFINLTTFRLFFLNKIHKYTWVLREDVYELLYIYIFLFLCRLCLVVTFI